MSGDVSFEAAVLPHLDAVWNLARRLCPDRCDAEDLTQETFLRALAGFGGWRGGDARGWLAVICLNAARSSGRRARARPRETPDVDLVDRAGRADTGEEACRRVERDAVLRALAALPEGQRVAIELVDVAGLTARETAEVLGCPRGTVLARVHRGRRRLAQILDAQGVRDDR